MELTPPFVLKGRKYKTKKKLKRALKRLRNGEGRLAQELAEAVEHVAASVPDAENKVFVPVVLVVRHRMRDSIKNWPFARGFLR